jgi:hypothetical protein
MALSELLELKDSSVRHQDRNKWTEGDEVMFTKNILTMVMAIVMTSIANAELVPAGYVSFAPPPGVPGKPRHTGTACRLLLSITVGPPIVLEIPDRWFSRILLSELPVTIVHVKGLCNPYRRLTQISC